MSGSVRVRRGRRARGSARWARGALVARSVRGAHRARCRHRRASVAKTFPPTASTPGLVLPYVTPSALSTRTRWPRTCRATTAAASVRLLSEGQSRALMLVRLVSLATGYSVCGPSFWCACVSCSNRGVSPVIPSRGSVGASGDLTPLSYVVALLVGERSAWHDGASSTRPPHCRPWPRPWSIAPKESLAIMNGTSLMAALGCLAFKRAERTARAGALLKRCRSRPCTAKAATSTRGYSR